MAANLFLYLEDGSGQIVCSSCLDLVSVGHPLNFDEILLAQIEFEKLHKHRGN